MQISYSFSLPGRIKLHEQIAKVSIQIYINKKKKKKKMHETLIKRALDLSNSIIKIMFPY